MCVYNLFATIFVMLLLAFNDVNATPKLRSFNETSSLTGNGLTTTNVVNVTSSLIADAFSYPNPPGWKAVFSYPLFLQCLWLNYHVWTNTKAIVTGNSLGGSNLADYLNTAYVTDTTTGMVGIVGYSIYQSTIYITYRGTANFENIYEDIQFTQVPFGARNPIPCNNCYSHAGFLDCHTATLAGIWKGFLDLQKTYPTFQVVVTGWSLGGAVASLMAVDMSVGVNGPQTAVTLMSLESPRTFDPNGAAYADSVLSASHRVTHYWDPIPHYPLDVWGYYHMKGERYISPSTTSRFFDRKTDCDTDGSPRTSCAAGRNCDSSNLCAGQWYGTNFCGYVYCLAGWDINDHYLPGMDALGKFYTAFNTWQFMTHSPVSAPVQTTMPTIATSSPVASPPTMNPSFIVPIYTPTTKPSFRVPIYTPTAAPVTAYPSVKEYLKNRDPPTFSPAIGRPDRGSADAIITIIMGSGFTDTMNWFLISAYPGISVSYGKTVTKYDGLLSVQQGINGISLSQAQNAFFQTVFPSAVAYAGDFTTPISIVSIVLSRRRLLSTFIITYTVGVPADPFVPSAACFAGFEQVSIENGHTKSISDVQVGDRVLTVNAKGEQVYSDVVYLPHGRNTHPATFVQVATESGRDLKMTLNHNLPAGACALSILPIVAASLVVVGDCVQTVNGREQVVSIGKVEGKGIYTVIAMEELIVVNGIVATPYGGVNSVLANIYYNLHRLMYSIHWIKADCWMQGVTESIWGLLSTSF